VNTFPAHPKLDEHELLLAQMQFADFRSANLFRMLTRQVLPGTLLDVGCGGGGMVAWLVEHGHDARGIDLNADTVAVARPFLASRGCDPMRVSSQGQAEAPVIGHDRLAPRWEAVAEAPPQRCGGR